MKLSTILLLVIAGFTNSPSTIFKGVSATPLFLVMRPAYAIALAAMLHISAVHGDFIQQGHKLVGTGEIGKANQGYSVALNFDGNTLANGGPYDNSSAGAVWIFTRNGAIWSQQGDKLVGTGAVGEDVYQGNAVALSSDGNILACGGLWDNSSVGAVWIFTRDGAIWSQQGEKLVGTGAVGWYAYQGSAVALSSSGNTLASGGSRDNSSVGAVWIFIRNGTIWSQQGEKLVGTGVIGETEQGASVALSSDGNTLASGGSRDNSSIGAVWIFTRQGTIWAQQGDKLVGTGPSGPYARQGYSVALSSDGNTLASGGPVDNFKTGAVWIFIRTGTNWAQQGDKLVGTGATGNAQQGYSVALSGDGNILASGGNTDYSDTGAAWIFIRTGTTWVQQGVKLVGSGGVGITWQGQAVALSGDGNTFVTNGNGDTSYDGAVWVFAAAPTISSTLNPTSGKPTYSPTAPTIDNGTPYNDGPLAGIILAGILLPIWCCCALSINGEAGENNRDFTDNEKICVYLPFMPIILLFMGLDYLAKKCLKHVNEIRDKWKAAKEKREADALHAQFLAQERLRNEEAYKNNAVQKATELGTGDLTNPYANVRCSLQ